MGITGITISAGGESISFDEKQTKAFMSAAKERYSGKQKEAFASDETGESASAKQLKAFIDRVERLEAEKAGISSDIKEIYDKAKGTGFDTKTIRKIIALRKKDPAERHEEEALLDLYMREIGME